MYRSGLLSSLVILLSGFLSFSLLAEDLRTRDGLVALYEFNESGGNTVEDTSGTGNPLDLEIDNINTIRRTGGSLQITSKALIRSRVPASDLMNAIRATGEVTLEAWVTPGAANQDGPARILTLSRDSVSRNFTLGHDDEGVEVRYRTSETSNNGLPSVSSGKEKLGTDLTHLVYTRDPSGRSRLYKDGEMVGQKTISGDLGNWETGFHLGIGNELSGGRPWKGAYHLVAVFDRALVPEEVNLHHRLGPDAATTPLKALEDDANARLFETSITSILSKHCLECHDAATRKGKLDLSTRMAAFKGGRDGESIIPGSAEESILWHVVESDEMPEGREPLSAEEKELLREWIDGGAIWSVDAIDPLAHKRDQRAAELWVRRLTQPEYTETVRAVMGVDISKEAAELLPQDTRADGFRNTAYNLGVDFQHIEAYSALAETIVSQVDVEDFARQFGVPIKFTDKTMGDLIEKMGRWVLRGPLEEREVIAYRGISTSVASAGGTYEEAVELILMAMLQSPRFIYQIENQRGGRERRVSQHELASRLSYTLWGGPPDRALLKAADEGKLSSQKDLEGQVDRMLQDPRAVDRSLQFVTEWLNLDRLQNLRPNDEKFPDWDPVLAEDMKAETLAFFKELVWEQKRPLADLLNAEFTWVTPRLAEHYNLDVDLEKQGLQRASLPEDSTRGGLMTHGSILTIGGDEASMVTRGLFVLHDLLRSGVNDPPPGLDTTPVPAKPGLSQRMIAMDRVADSSCGGCHSKFEPLAYGLEQFDGLGRYFQQDEFGNDLRQDGEILFPGEAEAVPFQTSSELMDLLAESARVRENFTWKIAQFALGRPLVASDQRLLDTVHEEATENGQTWQATIRALVLSDLVQKIRAEDT